MPARLTTDEWYERFPDLVKGQELINSKQKVWFHCFKGHLDFEMKLNGRGNGFGCPQCGIENRASTHRFTTEDFYRQHLDAVPGQKYVNSGTKLWFRCLAGKRHPDFSMAPNVRKQGSGCNFCYRPSQFVEIPKEIVAPDIMARLLSQGIHSSRSFLVIPA